MDDAINIRGLKRVAADFAGEVDPPAPAPSTGKKIAVIGGGPGGLSAAYYLQLMGHQTTVYEMLPELGGMLRYGIPNYRLPKERLEDDIRSILKTGVQVKHGLKIGKDITIQELQKEYDAILIAIGASADKKLRLDHEDADGVLSAVEFLRSAGLGELPDLTGKQVVVVGGGNVSMDAVRTAKRMGAEKVSILYRRRRHDMTALPEEIEGAVAEGIELLTLKAPSSIDVDENGRVRGIWATPQMVSAIKDGRAGIQPTGEPDVYIPCDVLIRAIGQDIETSHFEEAGVPVQRGKIITRSTGDFENMPGVFAGGDCASGPASVIKAIAAAKVVAANIDEYLGFRHEISCDVEIPDANLEDRTPCGRVNLTEREACQRVHDFEGVENCTTWFRSKAARWKLPHSQLPQPGGGGGLHPGLKAGEGEERRSGPGHRSRRGPSGRLRKGCKDRGIPSSDRKHVRFPVMRLCAEPEAGQGPDPGRRPGHQVTGDSPTLGEGRCGKSIRACELVEVPAQAFKSSIGAGLKGGADRKRHLYVRHGRKLWLPDRYLRPGLQHAISATAALSRGCRLL